MSENQHIRRFDKRAFGTKTNKNVAYVHIAIYISLGASCFLINDHWSHVIFRWADEFCFTKFPTEKAVLLHASYPLHYAVALLLYAIMAMSVPPLLYIFGFRTPYRKGHPWAFIFLILMICGGSIVLLFYSMDDISGESMLAITNRIFLEYPVAFLFFYGGVFAAFAVIILGIIWIIVDSLKQAVKPILRLK